MPPIRVQNSQTSVKEIQHFSGLQFLEWFHQVEVELQRRDDAHIHAGVRSLEQLLKESAGLVDRTEEGLNNIQVLENQYKVRIKI